MQSIPVPNLEVRDLQVALALAQAGSTGRAAALLHITQPAVSRALLSLEEKLGVCVFERTPRGLSATPAGERLLAGATELLAALRDLELRVRSPEPRRSIRIVCECYTAYHWLPSALLSLRHTLPGLDLSLAVEETSDPVAALEAGRIEAALVTTAVPPATGPLRQAALFSDEVVFVLSRDHPLAKKKALTAADVRASTLLTSRTPAAETHWFLTRVFGRARPKLNLKVLPLTEALIDMARAGLGVAVLSEWIASPHLARGDLVAKRLASAPMLRPWRLLWHRELDSVAARLRSALQTSVPHARLVG